jgi:hypothetical protein
MSSRCCWAVVLLCAAAGTASQADGVGENLRAVLTRDFEFSGGDLADLERGQVVKRALRARGPGEVAVVGALRINAPKARLLDRVRDVATFKRGPEILQIGTFSAPPSPSDLAPLTIDTGDFDVRACRLRDCDVRLPASAIARFAAIDPDAADAQTRGAALFKQILFEQVAAYVSGSGSRFTQYDDGTPPIRPLEAFDSLLAHTPAVGALVPGLREHLRRFPAAPLAGAQDLLYWSKEKFGLGPFITVTHMTIVCPSPALCVVGSRDVYSSRYIDASFSMTLASDVPQTPGAFYLVYLNRTRASALTGFLSGFRRSIAERRARAGLEERLTAIARQLER